jgi:hypothetical protein
MIPTVADQNAEAQLFILIKNPLAKRPAFFAGHTPGHEVHITPFKHCAKKLDFTCAKAWSEFLQRNGHEFFIVAHEPKDVLPRIKILR